MSTILLVEDSPTDQETIRTILGREGYEVHELTRGRAVPDEVARLLPMAVILDVHLPDLDGPSVCRMLRADPKLANLPVLMLTSRGDEPGILAGLEAGADDFVAKEAAPEIILARVRRLVRYRQLATLAVLNDQLVQLGRLLAGIVHEIRGPLAVIRGNAEMMNMTLGPGHETQRWIEPILRNAQLLQTRLEHLMAAVRSGPVAPRVLELPPLLREAADLFLRGTEPLRGEILLHTEFASALPAVQVDPGRLLLVLINLLTNAQDAIHQIKREGHIWIRAEQDDAEAGGPWIKITVHDDGPGIPESHLGRVFEACFTTKPNGSGYGLYLASEILREHGGRLTAANAPGGGACFTLWLPTARPENGP